MTDRYNGVSASNQLCLGPADNSGEMYNSTLTKSPPDPPLLNSNGYDSTCGENRNVHKPYVFPVHSQGSPAAMGLIPVEVMSNELDIANFYETQSRQRKLSRAGKDIPPHVLSRRRAQNRASQRAYRDRRDKRIRENEERLTKLQEQHYALTQSYETLELEYSAVKEELKKLQSQSESGSPIRKPFLSWLRGWDEFGGESTDPSMFDAPVFGYDVEGDRK